MMLVLDRKVEQEILIQVPGREPIVMKVLSVGEKRAKLGFDADDDIKIFRKELVEDR